MEAHPYGWLSLVPPLVAIVLAIATRKAVLSLVAGIFCGALLTTGGNVFQTLDELKKRTPMLVLQPTIDQVPESTQRICIPRLVHDSGLPFSFSLSLSQSSFTF